MKNIYLKISGSALLVCTALIAACNGGGGGDDGGAPSVGESTPLASKVTLAPSLGRFSSGTKVVLQKLDGTPLGEAVIGDDGMATIELNGYSGPVLAKVLGGAGVRYFDEVAAEGVEFPAGSVMRAVLPAVGSSVAVGITPLTEAAASAIGNATDADSIAAANARVAAMFGLADILLPPQLLGASSSGLSSADSGTDYAMALYALLAGSNSGYKPHQVMADLGDDLSDGVFDGKGKNGSTVAAYSAASLTQRYQSLREQGAARYGDENTRNSIALIPAAITPAPLAVPTAVGSDLAGGKLWMREVRIAGLSLEQEFRAKGIKMHQNMAQLGSGTASDMESVEAVVRTMDAIRQMKAGISPRFIPYMAPNSFFVSDFTCRATLLTPGDVTSVSNVACRYGYGGKRYGVRVTANSASNFSWDSYTYASALSNTEVPFGASVDGSIDVSGNLNSASRIGDVEVSINGSLPLYNADPNGVRSVALTGHWVSDGVSSEMRSLSGSLSRSKSLSSGQVVSEKLTINSGTFASFDSSSGTLRMNLSLKAEAQNGFSYTGQVVIDDNKATGSTGRQIPTSFSLQGDAFDGSDRFAGLTAKLTISNPEVLTVASNGDIAAASLKQLAGSFAMSLDVLRSDGRPAKLTLAATASDGANGEATLTFVNRNLANIDKTVTIGFKMVADTLQMPVKAIGDGYEINFTQAGSSWNGTLVKGPNTLAQINASRINYVDGTSESLM